MKKVFAVILLLAILCTLTGCLNPKSSSDLPRDYPFKILQNIEKTIQTKNANKLSRLFAEYYNVTANDAKRLFDVIDGKVISTDNDIMNFTDMQNENGKYTYYKYSGDFVVTTQNKTKYRVYFTGYSIFDEEPEKVGLEYIYIENSADKSILYGIGNYQSSI